MQGPLLNLVNNIYTIHYQYMVPAISFLQQNVYTFIYYGCIVYSTLQSLYRYVYITVYCSLSMFRNIILGSSAVIR